MGTTMLPGVSTHWRRTWVGWGWTPNIARGWINHDSRQFQVHRLRTIPYLCFPPIIGLFVVCPTDPNPPLRLARRPNRDGSHRRALLDPLLHMHKKGRELQNQEERLNRILSHHCCKFTLYLHAHGPVSCLCGERNYKQAAPTPVFCYYKQAAQHRGFVTTSRRHNTPGFCYYKPAAQHGVLLLQAGGTTHRGFVYKKNS